MKAYIRGSIIISTITIAAILCLAAVLLVFDVFEFRCWVTEKTGWFYPVPQPLESIGDIEQLWKVSIPEGSYVEDRKIAKADYNMAYIKYKPYEYEVRIVISKDKTEEFINNVHRQYADITLDDFGKKSEVTFPEIMSDFQDIEFTYEFWCVENAMPNDRGRLPVHRSIYIFEEEDKTTVYLSV